MMNGMNLGGLAMMITSSAAALAVLALVILTIVWLARDLQPASSSTRAARGGTHDQP